MRENETTNISLRDAVAWTFIGVKSPLTITMGMRLMATVRTALSKPIPFGGGGGVSAGASVGIALYPHHGTEMNDLLGVADQSMYECKATGQMSLH